MENGVRCKRNIVRASKVRLEKGVTTRRTRRSRLPSKLKARRWCNLYHPLRSLHSNLQMPSSRQNFEGARCPGARRRPQVLSRGILPLLPLLLLW